MPINVFHGVARKVAVLFAALSGIGWVACVVGCVADLVAGANPTSEPYYAAIVVGIMVYVGAVIQAALWRCWSAIAGTVTALLSVMYLAATGFVLLYKGTYILHWRYPGEMVVTHYDYLMFIGGLVSCFFWAFVLMLWPFYSNPPQDGNRDATRAKMFKGVARKMAILFILLSVAGWIVVFVGLGLCHWADYLYWSMALMGPLTYIAALIHAWPWKGVSKAMGATAAFLSVVYITALGSITVSVGMQIYWIDHKESAWHWNNVPSWMKLQFLGGIILCFFWAIVLMLWPWYSHTYTQSSALMLKPSHLSQPPGSLYTNVE